MTKHISFWLSLLSLFAMTVAQAHAVEEFATNDGPSELDSSSEPSAQKAPQKSSSVGAMRNSNVNAQTSRRSLLDSYWMNYFSIFDGPAVGNIEKYQPRPNGSGVDLTRPVVLRNYVTGGFDVDDQLSISGTGYWAAEATGDGLLMRDPYFRIGHNSLFSTDTLNLYGDLRIHFPISQQSRFNDLMTGIQAFQILSYHESASRFTYAAFVSSRLNVYGQQGVGDDLEFYLGPNANYQISPSIAATLLYEMRASHGYGRRAFEFDNEGTGLEPGISWDIMPNLNVNPYLHFHTGEQVSLKTTTIGFMLYWKFI